MKTKKNWRPLKKYGNIDQNGIDALFIWQEDSDLFIWMARFAKSELVQRGSDVLTFAATYRQFLELTRKPPLLNEAKRCLTKMDFWEKTQPLYLHKDGKVKNVKPGFAVHVSHLGLCDQYIKCYHVIIMLSHCSWFDVEQTHKKNQKRRKIISFFYLLIWIQSL